MSILSVDNISPIGSGTSVTVNSAATLVLNNANSTGIITATELDISGDIDVDGHTNLDNVNIAGVTTSTGNIYADNYYANSFLQINNNGNPAVDLISTSTSGSSRIFFGDPDNSLVGRLVYAHNGDYMSFFTAGSEKVRINSSGYVGINETNPEAKLHVQGDNTTNGTVFLEPDSNKGNNISHIHHGTHGNWYIRPASSSGYIYHDIGKSQFTNGILFGSDTAAANTLDDYEEGSWTPEITSQSGSITSYTTQVGSYTKIGRTVIAEYDIRISDKGNISGGYLLVSLPMNHAGSRAGSGTVYYFQNLNYSVSSLQIELGGATPTRGWLLGVTGTQNSQNSYLGAAYLTNTTQITGQLVYRVS